MGAEMLFGPTQEDIDEAVMETAVLRHMRRSVNLMAISAIHITVGSTERAGFAEKQELLRASGQPEFFRVDTDLSQPINPAVAAESLETRKLGLRASLADGGVSEVNVRAKVRSWEQELTSPASRQAVYVWAKTELCAKPLTDIHLFVARPGATREERFHARAKAARSGFVSVCHGPEATRLEFRTRTDGERLVTAIAAAPVAESSPETQQLLRLGMIPLGVDLSEIGLASGLQLWARFEGRTTPAAVSNKIEELQREEFWSQDLFHTIEMLQLTAEDVAHWHDVFDAMDTDGTGTVAVKDMVNALEMPYTSFTEHIARFLCRGETSGDLEFGGWARIVGTLGLMDDRQLAGLAFAFVDEHNIGAVTAAALMQGAKVILETATGGTNPRDIAKQVATLPQNRSGLITAPTFQAYAVHEQPALIYPAARLQDALTSQIMSLSWWAAKKRKFSEMRAKLRRTRDLAVLASRMAKQHLSPETLSSRFCEVTAERASMVAQVFTESRPDSGRVALVSLHLEHALKWASRQRRLVVPAANPLPVLCASKKLSAIVRAQIERQELAASVPRGDSIRALMLVPVPFTTANHMLLHEAPGKGGGPGAPAGEPNRTAIIAVYKEELDNLHRLLEDHLPAMDALSRNVRAGIGAVASMASAAAKGVGRAMAGLRRPAQAKEEAALARAMRTGDEAAIDDDEDDEDEGDDDDEDDGKSAGGASTSAGSDAMDLADIARTSAEAGRAASRGSRPSTAPSKGEARVALAREAKIRARESQRRMLVETRVLKRKLLQDMVNAGYK
jgi:Ca2+-binding EF-hand superfamily protein